MIISTVSSGLFRRLAYGSHYSCPACFVFDAPPLHTLGRLVIIIDHDIVSGHVLLPWSEHISDMVLGGHSSEPIKIFERFRRHVRRSHST